MNKLLMLFFIYKEKVFHNWRDTTKKARLCIPANHTISGSRTFRRTPSEDLNTQQVGVRMVLLQGCGSQVLCFSAFGLICQAPELQMKPLQLHFHGGWQIR